MRARSPTGSRSTTTRPVDHNEARYGSNYCGDTNCSNAWDLIRDGVTRWAEDQKAAGRTDAQIKADLAKYYQWDRYDFDGDGDFNEPDSYIDHFQIVHAGEDESAGGGVQGENALWAHRWYAYGTDAGKTGPEGNRSGGAQIGGTGIWVGDYTMQPENGGLGVFAHEYGHDLGLPDEYDTTNRAESSVGFWSLMSTGSWLGEGKDSIGDLPGDMNAWDKLQLGWLNYGQAKAATRSTHKLGVAEYNTKDKQALLVELPYKSSTTKIVQPAAGGKQWWSGMGNDLKNTLARPVDLTGKAKASLDLQGWWDIEENYDYLYAEVSTDGGGANWTPVDGTTDGKPLFQDGAEGDDNGWTSKGFSRIGESFTKNYPQYYIAENRQYLSYHKTLKVGPYNYGWTSTRPDWVEHYPYQNGLLIWLWDTATPDNNVSAHPGLGQILPVDAHAKPEKWSDGTLMRNRFQAYDSTFSHFRTDGFTVHKDGKAARVSAKRGVSVFDDRKGTYWYDTNPTGGVKVPDTNTQIKILHEAWDGSTMTLRVGPSSRK